MYIDGFHFSPFGIKDNTVSIWSGLFRVKQGKFYHQEKEISAHRFYDLFLVRARDTWFAKDFEEAFSNQKGALADIGEFAVYCQVKFQLFHLR
jgi:hypothetical protein